MSEDIIREDNIEIIPIATGETPVADGSAEKHEHDHHHHHHHHHSNHKTTFWSKLKRRIKKKEKQYKNDWAQISKRVKKNKKKTIRSILAILAIVLIAIIMIIIRNAELDEKDSELGSTEVTDTSDEGQLVFYEGKWYEPKARLETVLVMGIDKFQDSLEYEEEANYNTQQTDFNMLVIIDHKNKRYDILQINRDTMTDVKEYGLNAEYIGVKNEQLALAHTYGSGSKDSCRNVVEAVENLLFGVDIDGFIAFTMDMVPIVNDEAGGVTVKIVDDFSKIDPSLVMGEEITLEGKQSLTYVRSRKNMGEDESNINRMERHRTYVSSLRDAANEKMREDSNWIYKTAIKASEYYLSSYSSRELATLLDNIRSYEQSDIITIEGETKIGEFTEFYPDQESLKEQVMELFYTPTAD